MTGRNERDADGRFDNLGRKRRRDREAALRLTMLHINHQKASGSAKAEMSQSPESRENP